MKESLHYLLMSDHLMVQKALLNRIKDTGLTSGQPKILDYLMTVQFKKKLQSSATSNPLL